MDKKGLYLAPALREVLRQGYSWRDLYADSLAGFTVGIIAVPLAMALAIASGVPPQHGLYTAIVAGGLIALMGGTRLGVAGPTAAFVVLLQPIAAEYGLEGLLVATFLAGCIQVILGVSRLGYLVQYVPYPVTTGFTTGIGAVIAFLQIRDLLGLQIDQPLPEHFLGKLFSLAMHLSTWQAPECILGMLTLMLLFVWQHVQWKIPGHLPVLLLVTIIAYGLSSAAPEWHAVTLGERFAYTWNGQIFPGVPPYLPAFHWLNLTWHDITVLIRPALGLALLGAIESLLCAVVADGFSGTKHFPNTELVAQGVANMVGPFWGGIMATNAIARTTANIRSGAKSPLSALIHAITVLLCMLVFAPYLSFVPMSTLAGILIFVAYQMADLQHFKRVMQKAPGADKMVLWTCFLLTVLFDMVVAVAVGMVLACFLFMQRMISASGISLADPTDQEWPSDAEHIIPERTKIYRINGPLFFGAAEKAIEYLKTTHHDTRVMVLWMKHVPSIDMTAFVALESLLAELHRQRILVIICGLKPSLRKKLDELGMNAHQHIAFSPKLSHALQKAKQYVS